MHSNVYLQLKNIYIYNKDQKSDIKLSGFYIVNKLSGILYLDDLKHRDGLWGALTVSHQQVQQAVTIEVCDCGA